MWVSISPRKIFYFEIIQNKNYSFQFQLLFFFKFCAKLSNKAVLERSLSSQWYIYIYLYIYKIWKRRNQRQSLYVLFNYNILLEYLLVQVLPSLFYFLKNFSCWSFFLIVNDAFWHTFFYKYISFQQQHKKEEEEEILCFSVLNIHLFSYYLNIAQAFISYYTTSSSCLRSIYYKNSRQEHLAFDADFPTLYFK